jgi:hypothetical protein
VSIVKLEPIYSKLARIFFWEGTTFRNAVGATFLYQMVNSQLVPILSKYTNALGDALRIVTAKPGYVYIYIL